MLFFFLFCMLLCCVLFILFFFSSRRRHTSCALVTGVQTCALPISVTASIRLRGANAGSILVPHGAIQTIKGRPTVFVRTDHGFKATPIVLGPQSGDHVVVTSGLRGDERIAAANSFTLKAELGKGEAEHGH